MVSPRGQPQVNPSSTTISLLIVERQDYVHNRDTAMHLFKEKMYVELFTMLTDEVVKYSLHRWTIR